MDLNLFNFKALFNSSDFKWCNSPELEAADREFDELLKRSVTDRRAYFDIDYASNKHTSIAQESGFEQGFRFAVKLMKRLYDMSGEPPKTK